MISTLIIRRALSLRVSRFSAHLRSAISNTITIHVSLPLSLEFFRSRCRRLCNAPSDWVKYWTTFYLIENEFYGKPIDIWWSTYSTVTFLIYLFFFRSLISKLYTPMRSCVVSTHEPPLLSVSRGYTDR